MRIYLTPFILLAASLWHSGEVLLHMIYIQNHIKGLWAPQFYFTAPQGGSPTRAEGPAQAHRRQLATLVPGCSLRGDAWGQLPLFHMYLEIPLFQCT